MSTYMYPMFYNGELYFDEASLIEDQGERLFNDPEHYLPPQGSRAHDIGHFNIYDIMDSYYDQLTSNYPGDWADAMDPIFESPKCKRVLNQIQELLDDLFPKFYESGWLVGIEKDLIEAIHETAQLYALWDEELREKG